MASKVHFNSAVGSGIRLGEMPEFHKVPADPYGNLEASADWAQVDCKVCLRHKPEERLEYPASQIIMVGRIDHEIKGGFCVKCGELAEWLMEHGGKVA